MPSVAVHATNLREVRSGLLELLRPVVRLRAELVDSWSVAIDTSDAKRRVRAGRPAFDAIEVLQGAGDLRKPFHRATQAFERAGLASAESALAARQQISDGVLALGASWIAGEPLPRQEPRRLAQRAAALVAGSVLAQLAGSIRSVVRHARSDRTSCPACGSAAEFSMKTPQGRRLICARCDSSWITTRKGCVGCAADESPTVCRIPSPDVGYDLVVCNACGRYLKERVGRGSGDLFVERGLTAQLDEAAERRGLRL